MQRFDKWFPIAYSPLFTALAASFWAFLALVSMLAVAPVPAWIWLVVLAGALVGVFLQFVTRRVLVIRLYDFVMYSIAAMAGALLTWRLLVLAWGAANAVFAGIIVLVMFVGFGIVIYGKDRRNPRRMLLPCAATGKLDLKTGLIVDPRFVDNATEYDHQRNAALRAVLSLSPLIAGLSMMLVRGLPDANALFLFLAPGIFIAALMTWFAFKTLSFLVGTVLWEREHGKRIYVKR